MAIKDRHNDLINGLKTPPMDFPDLTSHRTHRSFEELSDDAFNSFDPVSFQSRAASFGRFGWDELLKSDRVLIVSEAGAGKTYECRAEQLTKWNAGEAAFYLDLAQLCQNQLRELLLVEEELRFDAWLASQSDVATIFLDSIDELKLTLGSFEVALKRLNKALMGQLGRVRIVITTRPIPIDYRLVQQLLPVPKKRESTPSSANFADIAMSTHNSEGKGKETTVPIWRNVTLLPLSDDQIRSVATLQGVADADEMLKDIRRRNAEDFARRPQDLIELCADWRDYRRIRTHREQVAHNVAVKLKPRIDRREKAQLPNEKAIEGAGRLALAALLTRKLTLRHSAEADRGGEPGTALDPSVILMDWSADERETLLERALFGFASYGRVRFHHRSVIEYLAAQRLRSLLDFGMSVKAVKRLLFVETLHGLKVVKPSMQPVAAWLASSHESIFSEVRDREPDVLLDHADPESLSSQQRIAALDAYVRRYGQGGWRGKRVPQIQVHRFASQDLAPEVLRLWHSNVENPEVRELLLKVIAAVPMVEGADIAFSVVMNRESESGERMDALEVLINLRDPRSEEVIQCMQNSPDIWDVSLLRNGIIRLFPNLISPEQVCVLLARAGESAQREDEFNWFWQSIADAVLTPDYLESLRKSLTELLSNGLEWRVKWPHIASPKRHLAAPLAAVCLRQFTEGCRSETVIQSSVLALRFARDEYTSYKPATHLRAAFGKASSSVREAAFWADDTLMKFLTKQDDPRRRFMEANFYGPIALNAVQDATWVLDNLSDLQMPLSQRSLMLEVALQSEWRHHLLLVQERVADSPTLTKAINDHLKPAPVNRELIAMELRFERGRRQSERRRAKDHESWVMFWMEVANNPQTAFSPDRAGSTAWNLWTAISRSGEESRASGWSRSFIERHFSKEVADRLRSTMTTLWRNDCPSMRSERPRDERDTFLTRWQLGLAGIAAEAEDPNWAKALSIGDARLASRYALLELNGFPSWLANLAEAQPVAVDEVLGAELTYELNEIVPKRRHSMLLENIAHATPALAGLFQPRLKAWMDENIVPKTLEKSDEVAELKRRVLDVLLKNGDEKLHKYFVTVAANQLTCGLGSATARIWLPVMMWMDPAVGVEHLEQGLNKLEPGLLGSGVDWMALLFGEPYHEMYIDLRTPKYSPRVLLRLLRLAYSHVRPFEDITHEGAYSPSSRDHAQRGRDALLSALMDSKGPEAWNVKLEMADDPLFARIRDRTLLMAREGAAREADVAVLSEAEVVALIRNGEAPPITRTELFALLVDRLDDIEDLLLRDDSPRAAWAGISEEKVMRREIARELRNTANQAYTVDQEGVTADEKETDIRLRATASDQQAVIELKLGDGRTGRDLRDTIKSQLVTKYMASEECRSGCLLVTVAQDRQWEHPDSGERLDVLGLEAMLQEEALKISDEMRMSVLLVTRVLDLRPRLLSENRRSSKVPAEGST